MSPRKSVHLLELSETTCVPEEDTPDLDGLCRGAPSLLLKLSVPLLCTRYPKGASLASRDGQGRLERTEV